MPPAKTALLLLALAALAVLWGPPAHAQAPACDPAAFAAFTAQADDADATDVEDNRHFTINAASDFDSAIRNGIQTGRLPGEIATTSPVNYFRFTVPPLVVGELLLTVISPAATFTDSVASVCQGNTRLTTADPATDDPPRRHFRFSFPVQSDRDYFVVVAGKGGARGTYSLYGDFDGLIPTDRTSTSGSFRTSTSGSFTRNDQADAWTFFASEEGLLIVATTGSIDTIGTVTSDAGVAAADDNSGAGNNFRIVVPVWSRRNYTVLVEAQISTARGNYTLAVDFKVAAISILTPNVSSGPMTWDSGNIRQAGDVQYILLIHRYPFLGGTLGLTTIESRRHPTISSGPGTDVKGTLYQMSVPNALGQAAAGSSGLSGMDSGSHDGPNFSLTAVTVPNLISILKVEGENPFITGRYSLRLESSPLTASPIGDATPAPSATSTPQHYRIDVDSPGLLEVQTLGTADTTCTLHGQGGQQLATDANGGEDSNCRIFRYVSQPGFYWVTVQTPSPATYHLVARLVGVQRGTPGDGPILTSIAPPQSCPSCPACPPAPDPPDCPTPFRTITNATGVLEDPPEGGIRGGIGLIRGWVCAASRVEVRLFNAAGRRVALLDVPYGSSRPDTRGECGRRAEDDPALTGFGITWNFNELPEGTYTAEAWAGPEEVAQQIGQTNTFEVVHLTDDPFVRGLVGECRAPDFPAPGATTVLEWEQSIQGFVISGVEQPSPGASSGNQ